jgi:hypothetical protein
MIKTDKKRTGKKYEHFLMSAQHNYTSRINANDLLSLETALMEHLQQVQEALNS